ncbi:RNA polymerase II holoenzyme cyclin-like subunit [Tricharina praecox]|uniref:RNA polymerase II holoenzyme cyclin-like subunit n=1 Tax=Tricharina praecox TaxID=43433 RepID=UPI002220D4DB|nr:RNA polymerase II holoenzyme cyclin-like subunit [Tricharina praecox]KAI5847437.1 RNA polymerase II holoenzyme cyclin-like subunit [Tricharina praecox]
MAANYWVSSQRLHWQMSREKLAETRASLDTRDEKTVLAYPLPSYRHLSIYFNQQIARLGRRMQARQQALATAQLYVRRFYTKVPIRDTNPYLVMATCLYLALKMEECPQHIRTVVSEAKICWPEVMPSFPEKLAETEFYVISELNSYLIVHHPYRTLVELTPLLGLTPEDNTTSWQVINDSCVTDLPMIYPPHVIALTAIFLAVVLKPSISQASLHAAATAAAAAAAGGGAGGGGGGGVMGGNGNGNGSSSGGGGGSSSSNGGGGIMGGGIMGGGVMGGGVMSGSGGGESGLSASGQGPQNRITRLIEWYAESKVDMEAIIDCTQEIISLYELWEPFTLTAAEKACKEQICRMVKQRGIS